MSENKQLAEKKARKGSPLISIFSFFSSLSFRTKVIILASIVVLFSFAFPIFSHIAGNTFGTSVGVAVGSYKAITEDMPAAYQQGKKDGLSAKDTQTEIQNRIREVGKLDVLAANVQITDIHKIGQNYAALYEFGADVIFSVDITQAKVLTGDNSIEIIIPRPIGEVNIDSTKTKVKDIVNRGLLNGSSKEGMDAYFNSLDEIQKNARESIGGYESLQTRAEDSAMNQIRMLVDLLAEKGSTIEIRFEEKAGDQV